MTSVRAHHASNPEHFTHGTVEICNYDKKHRTTRALKILGKVWGLSVVSVFLPILHFFLPWMGILAGPIIASWVYGVESEILSGVATCPKCSKDFKIVKQRTKWPLHELCTSCQSEIIVNFAN